MYKKRFVTLGLVLALAVGGMAQAAPSPAATTDNPPAASSAPEEEPYATYKAAPEGTAGANPAGEEPRSLLEMQIIEGTDAVRQMERSVTGQDKFDINQAAEIYTMENSISKAWRQNSQIRIADEKVVQANAQYGQTQAQKNLQFVVSNKTTWQGKQMTAGRTTLEALSNQLNASLQLLLTTFGQVEKQIAAAYLQIGVAALDASAARRDLAYQVKQDFIGCLKAQAQVDVAQLNLQVTQKNLNDSKLLYRRGVMALYDVIQADLQVTEAREQLERSLSGVQTANATFLSDLEERPASEEQKANLRFLPPEPIEVDPLCELADLQELAMRRRLEIMSIDRSIAVAEEMRAAEESSNRPEIGLSADYIFSPGYRSYPCSMDQLNLSINWAAWDGGARQQKLMELDSQIRSLQASRDQLCNTIRLDVEKAWIEFQLSEVVLQTARKRVEAAWVHSDMARQRFLNGIGTSLEVQESLSNLNDARNSYVVATYDRDLSFAAIEHSVGCDFPDRRLEITPQLLEIPTPEGERP